MEITDELVVVAVAFFCGAASWISAVRAMHSRDLMTMRRIHSF